MTEEQRRLFEALRPGWDGYKRTLAWTFTPEQAGIISRLSWEVLNKKLTGCASCKVDAMRRLEGLYNG